jgi:hypothetical protein
LQDRGWSHNTLLITREAVPKNLESASRRLFNTLALPALAANVHDVLRFKHIVIEQEALDNLITHLTRPRPKLKYRRRPERRQGPLYSAPPHLFVVDDDAAALQIQLGLRPSKLDSESVAREVANALNGRASIPLPPASKKTSS